MIPNDEEFGPWIQCFSGRAFPLTCPSVDDFHLEDIAHHLSRINRFTGAIKQEFYTVAEHSVRVAYYLAKLVDRELDITPDSRREFMRMGLLHDAAEAYLNDVSSPLKKVAGMEGYVSLHKAYDVKIARRFGMPDPDYGNELWALVREADGAMLDIEKPILLGDSPKPWGVYGKLAKVEISRNDFGWNPNEAESRFLAMARVLGVV